MRRITLLVFTLILSVLTFAQQQSITFTSLSEARFFFYINGQLQNQEAVSSITFNNLEDKDYLFRIVADDPYEVAVVKTLRPSSNRNRYTLLFSPVKERIVLEHERNERSSDSPNISRGQSTLQQSNVQRASRTERKAERQAQREDAQMGSATSTGSTIHQVKRPVFDD